MDRWYPVIVVAPLLGLVVNCFTQVGAAWLMPGRNPYVSMVAGIVIGMVASLATTSLAALYSACTMSDGVAFLAVNAGEYLALAFGYFNFVNLTIASLRIRLLGELRAAGGELERVRLLEGYNTRKVIDVRIDRLVRGGHLVEREGRYFIGKRRFLAVARAYNALRWFVIGPWPGELADSHSFQDDSGKSAASS